MSVMDRAAAEAVLSAHGWLASAPADVRHAILGACQLRRLGPNVPVYTFEDAPAGVIGLAEGRLEMHLSAGPDDPTVFAHVTPGYWLADLEAPDWVARPVSAMTLELCTLLRISGTAVRQLCLDAPRLTPVFHQLLTINFATTLQLLAVLRRVNMTERVAAQLCVLAGADLAPGLVIRVTQAQLAAMVVLARSTVVKCLGELEARGLVAQTYRGLKVLDSAGLLAAARYTG